jgi:hypothetical protein
MVILIKKEKMVAAYLRNPHCPAERKMSCFGKIKGSICKIKIMDLL